MLGLGGQQPPHELVVLGVGDLGVVELVVAGVVVPDLLAKPNDQRADVLHAEDVIDSAPSSSGLEPVYSRTSEAGALPL